jgi:hypothetical protein
MKNVLINKFIRNSALFLFILFAYSNFVFAVTNPPADTQGGVVNPPATTQTVTLQNPLNSKINSLGAAVSTGVDIFTYLVVLGAVIAFIIVGLRYILARGNTEKIKEASKWLWAIIIGVAIVIGARVMIRIILDTLQSTGIVNSDVIQSANNALSGQKLNP